MTDIPYEKVVISQSMIEPNKIVAWDFFGGEDNIILMAEYSTPEKAEKAMLLLHKIYVKAPLENEAKEMGEFVYGTYKAVGTCGYVEPESNSFVFRFPREDEI